jgi:uncharacterized protein YceK
MKNYILSLLIVGLSGCSQIIFITTSGDSAESTNITTEQLTTSESSSSETSTDIATNSGSLGTSSSTSETGDNETTGVMRTECSLIAADQFNCLSGQVCIGESFEEKGTCVDTCINLCENSNLDCVIWDKIVKLPLPDGIGVCI